MRADELARVHRVTARLRQAEKPLRVLRLIGWPEAVKRDFFAAGCDALPIVSYPRFDPTATLEHIESARREIEDTGPVDSWLARTACQLEDTSRMLSARATPEFFTSSARVYGAPDHPLATDSITPLQLADHLTSLIDDLAHIDLGAPPAACHLALGIAAAMRAEVERFFGDQAPKVEVVDQLSANALAGPRRILIRRSACFTDRDLDQLVEHEARIHVATSLNGREQKLSILAAAHPGTTRTQEGLAVFAELITGSLDLDRLRRLADRVRAIAMAIEGADFLDVFRFFSDRTGDSNQAFESARRVFRGGVLQGGAPFTKDVVYLDGLLRVHSFLKFAVTAGRADCLQLLFCGKLAIEDIPALAILAAAGCCSPPRFVPGWASDRRFLVAALAYSAFLETGGSATVARSTEELLACTPRVPW